MRKQIPPGHRGATALEFPLRMGWGPLNGLYPCKEPGDSMLQASFLHQAIPEGEGRGKKEEGRWGRGKERGGEERRKEGGEEERNGREEEGRGSGSEDPRETSKPSQTSKPQIPKRPPSESGHGYREQQPPCFSPTIHPSLRTYTESPQAGHS